MDTKAVDELATYIDLMKTAQRDKQRAQEIIDRCRELIEETLGDAEIGTINGDVAVTWKHVTSHRLNQHLVKQHLTPEQLDACTTTSTSRRFTIIGSEE